MKTEDEIRTRIQHCEYRSKVYYTEAHRQREESGVIYWFEQSAIQDEIAHTLRWVLGEETG